ncbi:hypothetical protein BU23DRAFT_570035 [Bimuria novae-zelandiae CBS 107.79]|uniref:Uncharacterized protein n=1 Tax=Bimuria novae-zelandiae CBS 107.79 TaxID=1447943 RepID=A0A6A5V2L6_9PLEO|nr:hypothetical protein BU23DRAFT_570035 [Bimuria novae-zelandiae CBS 107.79]
MYTSKELEQWAILALDTPLVKNEKPQTRQAQFLENLSEKEDGTSTIAVLVQLHDAAYYFDDGHLKEAVLAMLRKCIRKGTFPVEELVDILHHVFQRPNGAKDQMLKRLFLTAAAMNCEGLSKLSMGMGSELLQVREAWEKPGFEILRRRANGLRNWLAMNGEWKVMGFCIPSRPLVVSGLFGLPPRFPLLKLFLDVLSGGTDKSAQITDGGIFSQYFKALVMFLAPHALRPAQNGLDVFLSSEVGRQVEWYCD